MTNSNRVFILPYSMKSMSPRSLAEKLGVRRILTKGSNYYPRHGDTIIYWGHGRDLSPATLINPPSAVSKCTNKIRFFEACERSKDHPRVPVWTTSPWTAHGMHAKGVNLVVRREVASSQGRGAEILNGRHGSNLEHDIDAFPKAPLYTVLVEDVTEFRIHVMDGNIIYKQQKLRKNNHDHARSELIRSYDNGWVFSSNLRFYKEDIGDQAIKAVRACGLDFGAVDMLWSHKDSKAYALEVNSAPGIEAGSLDAYAEAFKKKLSLK